MASSEAAGEDRLSQLSDTVLGHNMSFLPAFDVARAAVLWRRWCDTFVAVHTVSLHNRERQPVTADEDLLAAPPRYRRAGAPLHELHVAFRELRGVKHAVVDQWLSYAVELALPSGELHLDLRVFVDAACSLSHEPLAELDTTCRGEGRRQNPWQP
jgi:hypothetical protein